MYCIVYSCTLVNSIVRSVAWKPNENLRYTWKEKCTSISGFNSASFPVAHSTCVWVFGKWLKILVAHQTRENTKWISLQQIRKLLFQFMCFPRVNTLCITLFHIVFGVYGIFGTKFVNYTSTWHYTQSHWLQFIFQNKKYANKCVFTQYFSLLALKKCIQIYWAAIAAIKYHTVTHTPDAICRSVFFLSLKNMHSIFNIFLHGFLLSQHHSHRCKQTHVNIAKSLRFKRQRSNILRKCVGGKMVSKFYFTSIFIVVLSKFELQRKNLRNLNRSLMYSMNDWQKYTGSNMRTRTGRTKIT